MGYRRNTGASWLTVESFWVVLNDSTIFSVTHDAFILCYFPFWTSCSTAWEVRCLLVASFILAMINTFGIDYLKWNTSLFEKTALTLVVFLIYTSAFLRLC